MARGVVVGEADVPGVVPRTQLVALVIGGLLIVAGVDIVDIEIAVVTDERIVAADGVVHLVVDVAQVSSVRREEEDGQKTCIHRFEAEGNVGRLTRTDIGSA